MSNFKTQIDEDIKEYQEKYPNDVNMQKPEWAFNYWVLDKIFNEDEELILDKIIDYKDRGIDAYEWYEDTKELFLIQNKYYNETSQLSKEYVCNNFLLSIIPLENGTYERSDDLQRIFTQNMNDERFTVHLQLFVTNDREDSDIKKVIKQFNAEHQHKYIAEVLYLKDIEEKWYGEAIRPKKEIRVNIESVNSGTILSVNNDAYNLENGIDAKYVFTPVSCIYKIVKVSKEKGYPLFEKNIREYLGNKGINKNIYNTLKDKDERKNFFYYNNGITLICDTISSTKPLTSEKSNLHSGLYFTVKNPQIVNGCQTVTSIFTALDEYDPDDIADQFKDTFVMVKVLQIDPSNPEEEALSKNIVTYNNSQNAIDEKSFVANKEEFQRIKTEFEKKGFLLLTKQSDKEHFKEKYSKKSDLTKLTNRSYDRRTVFGLESLSKVQDFFIPLEKLLQVVLAFKENGLSAYTLKKDVLKIDTKTYSTVTEFIRSGNVTIDTLLDLYLLFMRSEKEKNKKTDDTPCPISFYLIDGFAKIECNERDSKQIEKQLNTSEKVNDIINKYKFATMQYTRKFTSTHSVDYIKMIKMDIDYELLNEYREMYYDLQKMNS